MLIFGLIMSLISIFVAKFQFGLSIFFFISIWSLFWKIWSRFSHFR